MTKPDSEDLFYVVNLNHHTRGGRHIAFWGPDDAGYRAPLPWSGKYTRAQIESHLDYYHTGDADIAVRCDAVEALGEAPAKGQIDGDVGPVVLNTEKNWKALLSAMICVPEHRPWPLWPGRRNAPQSKKASDMPAESGAPQYACARGG